MTQQDKTPGEKFTKAVEPFLEEVREMAKLAYHKLLSIKQELGHTLQKNIAPRMGIGGNTSGRVVRKQQSDESDKNTDK